MNKLAGLFTIQQLSDFLEMSRTYLARAQELSGVGHTLTPFERSYLPSGEVERCPRTSRVIYFSPALDEYPYGLKGVEGWMFATMTHPALYHHCLSKKHVLSLYPQVNMQDFLLYFSEARKHFKDPFSSDIEEWISEIAKENAKPYNNEYPEID